MALGPEAWQFWQQSLPEGETVRLGRSPRNGWKVPWDALISREHADLLFENGRLTVRCLGTARNPICVGGEQTRTEFTLQVEEDFRIGQTRFRLVDASGSMPDEPFQEFSYRREDLARFEFGDERRRLQALSRLPQLISESRTDEILAARLCSLLLEAIPKADVAAVVKYDDVAAVGARSPAMFHWESRGEALGEFRPSRRLIAAALESGESLLYFWPDAASDEDLFTRAGGRSAPEGDGERLALHELDWAFCTPIDSQARSGWCIYVSGRRERGTSVSEGDLKGDLRFARLLAEFAASIREVHQLQRRQHRMTQFFSPAVVEALSSAVIEQAALAPREQQISVLFCDVRGFSRRAARARHDLLDLLKRVSDALGVMTQAIMRYEGVIADFQGDAALAFWGWPEPLEDGPLSACRAALAMHKEFMNANQVAGGSLEGFQVGIGIGYGRAVAGRIGTEEQCKIGVFGPVVNLASRLEGMTKQFLVPMLIDEPTAEFVRRHVPPEEARVRRLGRVRPHGMDASLTVWELLPPEGEPGTISNELIAEHEAAVEAFTAGNWSGAWDLFERAPAGDRAKELIMFFMAQNDYEPPESWDGVIRLDRK